MLCVLFRAIVTLSDDDEFEEDNEMTVDQKKTITRLRNTGVSYSKIAKMTGINENTVKTFCRRNGLNNKETERLELLGITYGQCYQCGMVVLQYPGRKEKKFCFDKCRNKWWNSHLSQVKRKAMYEYFCPTCGSTLYAYGNRNRKYCSHKCYIDARFG